MSGINDRRLLMHRVKKRNSTPRANSERPAHKPRGKRSNHHGEPSRRVELAHAVHADAQYRHTKVTLPVIRMEEVKW